MNARVLAVLVALFLALSTFAVVLPVEAQPISATGFNIVGAEWGVQGSLVEVGPGSQDVPLTVTTQYFFTNTATAIVATLTLPQVFTDLNGMSNPSSYVSTAVPSGSIVNFTFYLDISPNASVGKYIIPITIQWGASLSGSSLSSSSVSIVQSSSIAVQMSGKVKLVYQVTPTSIPAGEVDNVTITLTNQGSGPASQISTTVSPSSELSVLNTLPGIASVDSNSSVAETLQVYAPSASAGSPVILSFTATYTDAYGSARTVSQSVGLFVALLPTISPLEITVTPDYLHAGFVNNMTVTLTNQGFSPIQGLSATFSFAGGQATWLSPVLVQETSIGPGESVSVEAQAYDPPTTAGSLTLQGSLTYTYNDVATQDTMTLGLLSRGLIDLELTSSVVLPQSVAPGGIVSITLSVTNVGIIEASAVTAAAEWPEGFQSIGASSTFIGDMPVDSPSTFTISALVSNYTVPSAYTIPITLNYFDNLRTPLIKVLNVTVGVVSAQAGVTSGHSTSTQTHKGAFAYVIYAVVVLVIVVIAFLYLRSRRSSRGSTQ